MQEDTSLCDKIITDIQNVLNNDEQLKEFSIVPILENERNKSPVLYQEHNLGLEMWCVKHVYEYCHAYIFKVRSQLKKNRLSQPQIEKLNKLLMGAVLIQPDVSTYWNMRRELIDNESIKPDKELLLTKLVLTHKSKSNEAFSHRRWIVNRTIKDIIYDPANLIFLSVEDEFGVAELAARKAQNNYHAWTYRIWLMENIPYLLNVAVLGELRFSANWISCNVSDHSGFHYRQHLFSKLDRVNDLSFNKFISFVRDRFKIDDTSKHAILKALFGQKPVHYQRASLELTVCVLLYELLSTIDELNRSYPGHESIWYHRRFVVYQLLKLTYEYFEISWHHTPLLSNEKCVPNVNIVYGNVGVVDSRQENGEKRPKQFKGEFTPIESCLMYKMLMKTENDFIKANSSSLNDSIHVKLAGRHEKWLKCVLGVNCID